MKKTKRRALYIIAALFATLFVISCLVGFAACGGGSGNPEEGPETTVPGGDDGGTSGGGTTATVSSVSVNPTTLALDTEVTKTGTITATVTMSSGTYGGSYSWSSDKTSVATVSGSGATATVTAVGQGSANVTVTVGEGTNAKTATCVVTVSTGSGSKEPTATVSSVSVSPETMSLTYAGETGSITATVTMSSGTYSGSYSWSSDNTDVATVSNSTTNTATVTAVANGTANVTVTVGEGSDAKSATCAVTVAIPEPATVSSVSLSPSTLALAYGDETGTTLTANVTMSDGSDYEGDYEWTSSDDEEEVVKVTDNGKTATVTPVSCGTATITVSVGEDDDVKTATCIVTVSEDHTAVEAGRITGSADVAEDFHFMFDETYSEGTTIVFDDSSVSAEYDAENKTYTLNGISGVMDETQGPVFSSIGTHVGCEYVGFIVNVDQGESVVAKSYSGEGATASEFELSYGEDTSFLIDLTNHGNDGAWYMELDVTYAGGDEETYKVVFGEIEKGVETPDDLQAAVNAGGEVALTDDIELTSSLTIGGSGAENVEVTLDLNGNELSYTGTKGAGPTIKVEKGATLTIVDGSADGSGTVDVIGDNNAALYNEGTVTIAGGTFERSKEDGMEEAKTDSLTDSYYTVENHGDMTIEDGAVIFNAGAHSTCLKNGGGISNDPDKPATLTINGGKICGGKYSVKNDFSGYLLMTGGTVGGLRSETDALPCRALDNHDNATITGGKLIGGNGGSIDTDTEADGAVAEGIVIYNDTARDSHTDTVLGSERNDETGVLTIGDGNGNDPEIIYEGVNAYAATPTSNDDDDEAPKFATGIAIDSGTVNFKAGTIKCTDEDEDRDYNFVGVYLTNGTLNVSGGEISGDKAIVIDCAEDVSIDISITGGTLIGNVVLASDVALSSTFTISATVTLDLNGYTLSANGDVVTVTADGSLTVTDGSVEGNGEIKCTYSVTGYSDNYAAIKNSGVLEINGGKIYGGLFAIENLPGGTLTVNDGTIGGARSEEDTTPYAALANWNEAYIYGGTLLGGNGGFSTEYGDGMVIDNYSGKLVIGNDAGDGPEIVYERNTNNTWSGNEEGWDFCINIEAGEVTINGGTITCNADSKNMSVAIYLIDGTLTVNGGTIEANEASYQHGSTAIMVDEGTTSVLTINGGTLSGTWAAVEILGGTVTVNGGTFDDSIIIYTNLWDGEGTLIFGEGVEADFEKTMYDDNYEPTDDETEAGYYEYTQKSATGEEEPEGGNTGDDGGNTGDTGNGGNDGDNGGDTNPGEEEP